MYDALPLIIDFRETFITRHFYGFGNYLSFHFCSIKSEFETKNILKKLVIAIGIKDIATTVLFV